MEFLNEFGVSPILLLAQVVNFTILLILLRLFLYKPVLKMLDERKQKVAKSIKDAETIEKRLAQTQAEQEEILDKARAESAKLIKEAKAEAAELSQKTLAETKATAAEMLAKNQQTLKLEKEAMLTEAKSEMAALVATATAKVAKKTLTAAENQSMVKEALKEMDK